MPYPIITKDGITIDGIPDDVPKDDPRLKEMVAQLRASGQKKATFSAAPAQPQSAAPQGSAPDAPQADTTQDAAPDAAPAAPQTFLEWLTPNRHDIGATARGAVGGAASPLTMFMDPAMELINMVLPENMKQLPPSQAIQMFLGMMGVPEAETKAQKLLQATTAGLAGGGATALAGRGLAMAPGAAGEVGKTLAAQPVQQMVSGAGSGAGAELAAQGSDRLGMPQPVKTAATLAGGMMGGGLASGIAGARAVPSPVGPVDEAAQAKVTLMTSDVRPPETFMGKTARMAGERAPLGTGVKRAAQQQERIAAVKDLVRQYGAEDLASVSDDVMADLLAKRSADLAKWSTAKNEVIDSLSGIATAEKVPVPSTIAKIDASVEQLKQLKTAQVKPVITMLEDWKQAIQGQDLRNIELLRKQIGEAFTAPEMASVRSTGEKITASIYPAVKEDMTRYIETEGGAAAVNKWKIANKELAKMMGELDLGKMKTALNSGEMTPEAVKALLFSAKKSDVEALYRNLTPEGQAAARSAVIAKAAEKARVASEQAGDYISPDKFMNTIKAMGTQVGVLFHEDDLKQLQGLMKVLDYTKRASAAALAPPTGVQLAVPATAAALTQVFGSGVEGFIGAMAASTAAGGLARVYESPIVRDVLTSLPRLKAGSPEEAAALKRMLAAIQALQRSGALSPPETSKFNPSATK